MVENIHISSGAARIAMPNRIDFSMYRGFMKSYTPLLNNSAIREIEIELSAVDYLDSFALDMLMLLKERATAANKSLALLSPSLPASKTLDIHFSETFNIRHTPLTQTNDCDEQRQSSHITVHEKCAGELQDSPPSYWHM